MFAHYVNDYADQLLGAAYAGNEEVAREAGVQRMVEIQTWKDVDVKWCEMNQTNWNPVKKAESDEAPSKSQMPVCPLTLGTKLGADYMYRNVESTVFQNPYDLYMSTARVGPKEISIVFEYFLSLICDKLVLQVLCQLQDPNCLDSQKESPLWKACAAGHVSCLMAVMLCRTHSKCRQYIHTYLHTYHIKSYHITSYHITSHTYTYNHTHT